MEDLTQLLNSWRRGDEAARDELLEQVYGVLREMAARRIGDSGSDVTLRPTVVVHDAVLRLIENVPNCSDRSHFFALLALKMRAVLVDHARARSAAKRGGGAVSVTLSHADLLADGDGQTSSIDVLALHQALDDLAGHDPRAAHAVEMAYFGGMTNPEIAQVLAVSTPTVERDLRFARAWLNRRLS